jgi:hypothetical protein
VFCEKRAESCRAKLWGLCGCNPAINNSKSTCITTINVKSPEFVPEERNYGKKGKGKGKGKAITLQALTDPEGSRSLRLPEFQIIGTLRWQGSQPYSSAAFTPRKYSWYSFLLEAKSTPGRYCGRKDYVNEKLQ